MEIVPQISTKTAINEAIGRYYSSQAVDSAVSELASEQQESKQDAAAAESSERVAYR